MDKQLSLPRSLPEDQGIASGAIQAYIESIETAKLELHSFMLLRHGHVVAESWWDPYEAKLPHVLFSLSKSFTSTAIGLAVEEGILRLDDQVISFFPDELPNEISANLAAMQIRHLLMMGTGQGTDTMDILWKHEEGNWVKAFFDVPVECAPGTRFLYNSGATYMLSAILQKVSNQKLLDYLEPRLLKPLNIQNATWAVCPRGIHTGGFGLTITTEDIAKFGQLYLQKGVWNGERLLPAAWIDEATSKQISNAEDRVDDWAEGYGYQFWLCRHGAYRGDGAFGQYCIVLPEQDAVIAITAGVSDMPAVLNEVWNILLPAMKSEPLALNEPAAASLQVVINNLKLTPPQLQLESVSEAALSGQVFSLEANKEQAETFSIRFEANEATLAITTPFGKNIVRLGRGSWLAGESRVNECMEDFKFSSLVHSSFTWQNDATLEITIRYVETPFYHTLVCHFAGEDIVIEKKINLSFGSREVASFRGKLI